MTACPQSQDGPLIQGQIILQLCSETVLQPVKFVLVGGHMRKSLLLAFAGFLAMAPLAHAQAGSRRDIRADERQLQQLEWRLRQDQNRLAWDRRHHAGRAQIRADEAQVRDDKLAIRNLRADIKRDREMRRRYRRQGL